MSEMNADLLAVSATLNDLASQIHDEKSVTNDPDAYSRLNDALIDINHRIAVVGGLIFAQRSDDIAAAAAQVQNSRDQLESAIGDISQIQNFLQTITSFLGLVDNVIGVARQAAAGV